MEVTIDHLHEKLHQEVKNGNVSEVREILALNNVKLCYACFARAQENVNAEIFAALLDYDASEINNFEINGDSLLMRDIIKFKSRNAELLINKGADVNYINQQNDVSVLYCAVANKSTPIHIIEKLLELKADVNNPRFYKNQAEIDEDYDYYHNLIICTNVEIGECYWYEYESHRYFESKIKSVNGDTPLLCLIKNYDKNEHGLDKVKFLIKYGADINLRNDVGANALMLAASLKLDVADLNLIKCLIENGALTEGMEDMLGFNALNLLLYHADETLYTDYENGIGDDLIRDYVIPATNLLIDAGDDLFLRGDSDSPLETAFSIMDEISEDGVFELIIHLIKKQFEQLDAGVKIDEMRQEHPLRKFVYTFGFIMSKDVLYSEISNIILSRPYMVNEYIFTTKQNICIQITGFYPLKSFDYSVLSRVSFFVAGIFGHYLIQILNWFKSLLEHNVILSHEDRSSLLRIFVTKFQPSKDPEMMDLELINYMINIMGVYVNSTELEFYNTRLIAYQKFFYKVPDCILISALNGNVKHLKLFLPYWNQHPLALLLFLCPWLEVNDRNIIKIRTAVRRLAPFLCMIGGPISHGTKLYSFMERYLSDYMAADSINAAPINQFLSNLHSCPASLKVMCRTIIRSNAVEKGNNLPNYLKSLVPHGLQNYISLTENYDLDIQAL